MNFEDTSKENVKMFEEAKFCKRCNCKRQPQLPPHDGISTYLVCPQCGEDFSIYKSRSTDNGDPTGIITDYARKPQEQSSVPKPGCQFMKSYDGDGAGNVLTGASSFYVKPCGNEVEILEGGFDSEFCFYHNREEFENAKWNECGLCGAFFSGDNCPSCFRQLISCKFCKGSGKTGGTNAFTGELANCPKCNGAGKYALPPAGAKMCEGIYKDRACPLENESMEGSDFCAQCYNVGEDLMREEEAERDAADGSESVFDYPIDYADDDVPF